MDLELVIANAIVIDGTGRQRFRADLGIREGKIAAIATDAPLVGRETIDASGMAVAPGFIDLHSHSEWIFPLSDHDVILAPLALQGITTVVTGQCGFSLAPVTDESIAAVDTMSEMMREEAFPYRWRSMGELFDILERDGLFLNAATLVGHGPLRLAAMGERASSAVPTPDELATMCRMTREAIREGAFGISTGLGYAPGIFAENDELVSLLKTAAAEGGIYAVHGRTYQRVSTFYPANSDIPHNVLSNREQLDLARQAGVKLQLSHLIFFGRNTWPTYRTVLQDIDRAADAGLDVAFDVFPYTVGNTTISVMFPPWFLADFRANINDPAALRQLEAGLTGRLEVVGRHFGDIWLLWAGSVEFEPYEGLSFTAIGERLGLSGFEAYMQVARVSGGHARILHGPFSGDGEYDEPLRTLLAHPRCAFMTDTFITRRGKHNPASFGTYPRVLGHYSRDLALFTLEEAVRRMTSYPAERIGLREVGRIAEGNWADLVVFDPATVADNTTDQRTDAPPTGIHTVLISGQIVAREGQVVSRQRCGRVLRC